MVWRLAATAQIMPRECVCHLPVWCDIEECGCVFCWTCHAWNRDVDCDRPES